jgi:DNA-binding XRE family transcriptional regulator
MNLDCPGDDAIIAESAAKIKAHIGLKKMTPKEIKILLLEHDIKQVQIAKKLKVSRTAVSLVIKGTAQSRRIKAAIAQALKMKIEDLWPDNHERAA